MSVIASPLEIDALVFDAYGTLFDVHSVVATAEKLLPGRGAALSQLWRTKQLEYTWLQSLMGPSARKDFAAVTAQALDYASGGARRPARRSDRSRIARCLSHARSLSRRAGSARRACAAPALDSVQRHARDAGAARPPSRARRASSTAFFRWTLAGIYKPSPRVYQLALDRLQLPRSRIGFVSSNCWDAIGAKAFGFTTFWINRAGAPVDRHGPAPDRIIATLSDLPPLLA